jgi:flagellar basal body-associated protein FliL
METIILIVIGLVALSVILYMMFDKSKPACHSNSSQCTSCSLYRGCDKYPDESVEGSCQGGNENNNED